MNTCFVNQLRLPYTAVLLDLYAFSRSNNFYFIKYTSEGL